MPNGFGKLCLSLGFLLLRPPRPLFSIISSVKKISPNAKGPVLILRAGPLANYFSFPMLWPEFDSCQCNYLKTGQKFF